MANKAYFPMVAPGYDNEDNLKPLHLYDRCYFQQYKYWINTDWSSWEGLEESAGGRDKPIRLPSVVWKFAALTKDEVQKLKEIIGMTTLPDALVTVRAYDVFNDEWNNYNGILKFDRDLQGKWNGYEWRDIEFTFRHLRKIA